MKRLTLFSLLVIFTLVLAACAPAATQTPTAMIPVTGASTATTAPSATPAITATIASTDTAVPTATMSPTATIAPTATATQVPNTIVDVAVANGSFKTLVAALQAAGLVDALKSDGPFTVFAPTDAAFAKLPAGTLESLLKPENKAKLAAILLYHVVPSKLAASDLTRLKQATTLDGPTITFKVNGDKVSVNNANVVSADVAASNGVIHVIDTVILPPDSSAPTKDIVDTAVANGSFTTLVAAVKAAGLVDTLKGKGSFTVFAPTDAAFKALPAGTVDSLLKPENKQKLTDILTYHVVSGALSPVDLYTNPEAKTVEGENIKFTVKDGAFYVNDVKVVLAALPTTNGVLYVINAVILPQKVAASPAPTNDIVDTAVADGRFKTLVAAVTAAGLVDTLKGKGPFTVFAPTDDAFAKLPAGTIDTLLKPENKQKLTDILTYHVVSGQVMVADVVKLTSAKTVEGKDVTIKVQGGKVYINDAQVIVTDIQTTNGVIHVIDTVLIPPM
jgi:transforming growth factor-beta-induced protein